MTVSPQRAGSSAPLVQAARTPSCRFCGEPDLTTFVNLGVMPLANSYPASAGAFERSYPLIARVCGKCLLVQVDRSAPPEELFSQYTYASSYAASWVEHARRYAEAIRERLALTPRSLVVEVASNDGYLLQHFRAMGIPILGIEPAHNIGELARAKGIPTETIFFDAVSAGALAARGVGADLIVANNVFAHVPAIRDFAAGFPTLLKPDGVVTIEFPHLLNLMREIQFDTIYHEHFSYLSLLAAERVLASVGLRLFDVEELPTHGGSLRLYACHDAARHRTTAAVEALRRKERRARLDRIDGYLGFSPKVERVRDSFVAFLSRAKRAGKKVAAYGAPAKGNTFLNYCGITSDDIRFTVDRNPDKQGRVLPGSHIPVFAPEHIRRERPDYVVILPWNLVDEIRRDWAEIAEWGGRFVTAIPKTRIL